MAGIAMQDPGIQLACVAGGIHEQQIFGDRGAILFSNRLSPTNLVPRVSHLSNLVPRVSHATALGAVR